ncbi:valine--tRNA ligase [Rhabdochlamydiaceae symbiont of Dictyostelium giganteum]|uniref:valine--tRNA ligase n=1 Tax=Rhabdochlamydiaceae symbiont of Dictyostelium giganteum TaxID=3342349 RepID=UPI00384C9D83
MKELPKAYIPQDIEDKISQFWQQSNSFKTSAASSKPPFTIVMPPPNVTGSLHMGHAIVNTLQDILVRYKRMCGFEAAWVPGTDHAGIATQGVVERHLIKTHGKRRVDFSREDFLAEVWKWKNESEGSILSQIKKLGCSCDWDRLAFTMDESRSQGVRTAFKKMFEDGLIYRGDYLVNWDPITQTALADDEVEYEEKTGSLYYIKYFLEDSLDFITVATVRPETIFGDTAVAVSQDDPRYQSFIGKKVRLPLSNRLIPVITDMHVDPSFGTGAVKVTPAHDPNDYAMAERHHLELLNIMTPDGCLNEVAGEFKGLLMQEARLKVAEKLKAMGFLEKVDPYTHRVGISYRSKAVIEPFLSRQWFVKLSLFKDTLINLVKTKEVRLIPESFENTYFHWIDNLRDWCISRQLWWGHRIPIWYSKEDPSRMICYDKEGTPPEVALNPDAWEQDPDVLDTWFSSALWPFTVLGWPEESPDLKKFFPTSILVTGHDILFFWVARMMMMSYYFFQKPPFKEVFLHGLIFSKSYWKVDAKGSLAYLSQEQKLLFDQGAPVPSDVYSKWEKMSKSKGNILDPLEMIALYGTDAVRMALASSTTDARQIDLDMRRLEEFKNFANKVWNGARFVLMNLDGMVLNSGIDASLLTLEDKWILSRLSRVIKEVQSALDSYNFSQAAITAYDFFWKEFCAYYVELSKPYLFGKLGSSHEKNNKQVILFTLLSNAIRLLHPMAPFITEELFQVLKEFIPSEASVSEPYLKETIDALQFEACALAPYPQVICPSDINAIIEEEFDQVNALVHAIRQIRSEMQIPPGTASKLMLIAEKSSLSFIQQHEKILYALVKLEGIEYLSQEKPTSFASTAVVGPFKLVLPLPQELQNKEKGRLLKEQERLLLEQSKLGHQLKNQEFMQKAPEAIIQKMQATVTQIENSLEEIQQQLLSFSS